MSRRRRVGTHKDLSRIQSSLWRGRLQTHRGTKFHWGLQRKCVTPAVDIGLNRGALTNPHGISVAIMQLRDIDVLLAAGRNPCETELGYPEVYRPWIFGEGVERREAVDDHCREDYRVNEREGRGNSLEDRQVLSH